MSTSTDLVVLNARVYTCDPASSWAEAIAVSDGLITAVGTAADVAEHVGADTVVVDAGGRMVMPGLADVHTHLMLGGNAMAWELTMPPSATLEEILTAVEARALSPQTSESSAALCWISLPPAGTSRHWTGLPVGDRWCCETTRITTGG